MTSRDVWGAARLPFGGTSVFVHRFDLLDVSDAWWPIPQPPCGRPDPVRTGALQALLQRHPHHRPLISAPTSTSEVCHHLGHREVALSGKRLQPAGEVTDLLAAWKKGEATAGDELFDRVYSELRRIAGAQVRLQPSTMAPTELVHETYLKLLGSARLDAADRGHFFSLAARAMRQILVDASRRRRSIKRGGMDQKIGLDEVTEPLAPGDEDSELLALEEALQQLAERSPRLVKVVELRHFAGLTLDEISELLEVSPRTLRRDWRTARAFLHARLHPSAPAASARQQNSGSDET